MKTVILVIASINTPLYIHYINTYWTKIINYTNLYKPDIDIFLLFNGDINIYYLKNIKNNVIIDNNITSYQPGILLKTLYAFDKLQNKYDIFFRTNLSSIINFKLLELYLKSNKIIYSGGIVWENLLRHQISIHNSFKNTLHKLDSYKSNTFISGSGFLLNKNEVKYILKNKNRIIYDLPDDVSIGLMMDNYKIIDNFTTIVSSNTKLDDKLEIIKKSNTIMIRLNHLNLNEAQELWNYFDNNLFIIFQ